MLRPFTNEEYQTMIVELTEKEPICFDMMCLIAQRALTPLIKTWCYDSEDLRYRQYEDDILQDTQIRLIKTCVTHFLRRKDKNYAVNNDPEEFYLWIKAVGHNMVKDKAKEIRRQNFRTAKLSPDIPAPDEFLKIEDDSTERFVRAFHIAVYAPKKPHIVLTWIMYGVLEVYYEINRIKATRIIKEAASDRTMTQIWMMIRNMLEELPDFKVSEEENDHIREALKKLDKNKNVIGDTVYREYYGNRGGKAAISDWIYRMNRWLGDRVDYESFD